MWESCLHYSYSIHTLDDQKSYQGYRGGKNLLISFITLKLQCLWEWKRQASKHVSCAQIKVNDYLWNYLILDGSGIHRYLLSPKKQSYHLCWWMDSKDPHQEAILGVIPGRSFPETWGMCLLLMWLALACQDSPAELQLEVSWWNVLKDKACSSGLTWLTQNKKINTHPRVWWVQQIISRAKCLRRH